jgi:excisionase family DNA binding protein
MNCAHFVWWTVAVRSTARITTQAAAHGSPPQRHGETWNCRPRPQHGNSAAYLRLGFRKLGTHAHTQSAWPRKGRAMRKPNEAGAQPRVRLIDTDAALRLFADALERCVVAERPEPVVAASSEPWLSIADAAAYAAVSEDTIREWIRLEQLPCGRAGRVLRVRRSAIDALLLSGSTDAPANAVDNDNNERAAQIMRELKGKSDG